MSNRPVVIMQKGNVFQKPSLFPRIDHPRFFHRFPSSRGSLGSFSHSIPRQTNRSSQTRTMAFSSLGCQDGAKRNLFSSSTGISQPSDHRHAIIPSPLHCSQNSYSNRTFKRIHSHLSRYSLSTRNMYISSFHLKSSLPRKNKFSLHLSKQAFRSSPHPFMSSHPRLSKFHIQPDIERTFTRLFISSAAHSRKTTTSPPAIQFFQGSLGSGLPFQLRVIIERLANKKLISEGQFLSKLKTADPKNMQDLEQLLEAENVDIAGLKFWFDPNYHIEKPKDQDYPTQVAVLEARVQANPSHEHEPFNIEIHGPTKERSNRILRAFGSDRFLRVEFDIECSRKTDTHISKVKELYMNVMTNGIQVGGRHFEFLCFSASQLRENTCYFFASAGDDINDSLTANKVRKWMGDFSGITSVAKLAARLGQNFSKTTATIVLQRRQIKQINDIINPETNANFTDGCGEISPDLAAKVAASLKLKFTPSAFQIRFGSSKGMLVVNPNVEKNSIFLRPSMNKFQIKDPTQSQRTIEVIDYAKFSQPAYLNRQFILILQALGVPDSYFLNLQGKYLASTNTNSIDLQDLLAKLTKSSHIGVQISSMILAGHSPSKDLRLKQLLEVYEKGRLSDLLKKAKIPVEDSTSVFGVADQSGLLKPNQVFLQISNGQRAQVIQGRVAVGKNPCIHPGDFRLLQAVDIPELRHLKNCVVFPTQGKRAHADEIGGGDLDGDRYFVTWDKELTNITPVDPMDYSASAAASVGSGGMVPANPIPAIQEYFLNSIFNANLGEISNCHQTFADQFGANSKTCLELAMLHSRAVDAPKTGDFVQIPNALRPRSLPHYMEKSSRISYRSKSVLGQLYDKAKRHIQQHQPSASKKKEQHAAPAVLDPDLLIVGREQYAVDARTHCLQYEQEMMGIFALTTGSERNQAVANLAAEYRRIFHSTELSLEQRLAKASAWYEVAYQQSQVRAFVAGFIDAVYDYLNLLKVMEPVLHAEPGAFPLLPIVLNPHHLSQSTESQTPDSPADLSLDPVLFPNVVTPPLVSEDKTSNSSEEKPFIHTSQHDG